MILTCPECATRYFVPDESLGASGRRVRCHGCGHTWRASAEEPLDLVNSEDGAVAAPRADFPPRPEAAAELSAPELPRAFRARAEQQRRLRRAAAHGAVWAGISAAFIGLLAAGWLFRVDVVRTFPRAGAAYAAVGLNVNPTGLEFEAVSARAAPEDPGSVVVSGAVRNVDDQAMPIPAVRVSLLDHEGARIVSSVVRLDEDALAPGAVQGFAAILADPYARAADVGVTFDLQAEPQAPAPATRPAAQIVEQQPEAAPLRPAMGPPQPEAVDAVPIVEHAPGPGEAAFAPQNG